MAFVAETNLEKRDQDLQSGGRNLGSGTYALVYPCQLGVGELLRRPLR